MAAARGRPRGGLEQEVLTCLAAADRPLSPADVLAELGGGLAYTTVMTTLSRLHAKGAVTRSQQGRGYVYRLPGELGDVPASVRARRMRRILEDGDDRAGVLARFVSDLSAEDEQVLLRLLADETPAAPET